LAANFQIKFLSPMALAGGGKMLTFAPSNQGKTNTEVIKKFLPVKFEIEAQQRGSHFITVKSR